GGGGGGGAEPILVAGRCVWGRCGQGGGRAGRVGGGGRGGGSVEPSGQEGLHEVSRARAWGACVLCHAGGAGRCTSALQQVSPGLGEGGYHVHRQVRGERPAIARPRRATTGHALVARHTDACSPPLPPPLPTPPPPHP